MEHNIEKKWGFFHTEKGLEEDKMARTADGQKFRYPLNYTEENGLKYVNLIPP